MSRIIKRYDNRKMYDTETRKYVALEDIAQLVRDGIDVKVVEQSSDNDITTQTLTQVIFEEGKKGRNPLSTEVLHDVIRLGNSMLDDGLQQVKKRIDSLIPAALNPARLFKQPGDSDLDELKKRIESLETLIRSISQADKDSSNNN